MQVIAPALVDNGGALRRRQQRERLRHDGVERLCAEAAADHQQPQRAAA